MRPADVTDEEMIQWEEERLQYAQENPEPLIPIPPIVWYAGCWLFSRLTALGCSKDLRTTICQAAGQRQSYSDNHWQTVINVLENYKKGIWEKPGEKLAAKLLIEKYGPHPDPKEVLADLLRRGANLEKIILMKLESETLIQTPKKC